MGDLQKHLRGVRHLDEWWQRRCRYFNDEICQSSNPEIDGCSAYLRSRNLSNRIVRVPGFERLVHVGSLNATLLWLSWSPHWSDVRRKLRHESGVRLSDRPPGMLDGVWLDRQLDAVVQGLHTRGEDTIRRVAGFLADASGESEPPWWAGFSDEVQEVLSSGTAADLCIALGLGHRRPGEWLLVWEYEVEHVEPLFRPTVLEANDSAYHYPSPPSSVFGITMPLRPGARACREVLHRPLRGDQAVDLCTGRLLQVEDFFSPYDSKALAALRSFHGRHLLRESPRGGSGSWFRRHELYPQR